MALNLITTISIALLLLLVQSPLATSFSLTITDDAPSAYELLQGYNFPVGLLPKGVVKYDLDESSGRFHAYLNGSCSFSLEGSYQLQYKSTISGIISNNRIKDLNGISVKVLFVWLNIVEVIRDEDELEFSVGIASASFPIENFYECPQCGCGLVCVNGKARCKDEVCDLQGYANVSFPAVDFLIRSIILSSGLAAWWVFFLSHLFLQTTEFKPMSSAS